MKKILYIERSKMFQILIRDLLTPEGYDVIFAHTGNEALDLLEDNNIDFIFTAYELEDMTADIFVEEIRGSYNYQDIPVILITSYEEAKNLKEFFRIGISDYILKKDLTSDDTIVYLKRILH